MAERVGVWVPCYGITCSFQSATCHGLASTVLLLSKCSLKTMNLSSLHNVPSECTSAYLLTVMSQLRKQFFSGWLNLETGSTLNRKPPGSPRTAQTPENIKVVRESILQSPRCSECKHAVALGMSNMSGRRILHQDLKFHPYKMMVTQELTERDWESRRELCAKILQTAHRDAVLMCSNEAHFHLNSCVNKQNFRYWSETNPQQVHERPLHSARVTVWCAIAEFGVVGPYFLRRGQ